MITDKKRICIVDDDNGVHEFLEDYIRSFSKDVLITHAYNGHEGLVKLEGARFDLLITDLNMPHMKGGNMLKHLFRLNKRMVPENILVFSGYVDPKKMAPTKVKNLTYMSKPFDEIEFNKYLYKSLHLKAHHKFKNVSDTTIINPFVHAVREVSRLSFDHEVELKRLFIKDSIVPFEFNLACSVNFFCDDLHGCFVLGMQSDTYFSYLKTGKDIDIKVLTDKSSRHFKTFTEQVMEFAQRELTNLGEKVHYTISEVEYGENVELVHLFKGPKLALEFEENGRQFYLEMVLKKSST
jgi:CheY-like chemotaxis protein